VTSRAAAPAGPNLDAGAALFSQIKTSDVCRRAGFCRVRRTIRRAWRFPLNQSTPFHGVSMTRTLPTAHPDALAARSDDLGAGLPAFAHLAPCKRVIHLPVERDRWFTADKTLAQYADEARARPVIASPATGRFERVSLPSGGSRCRRTFSPAWECPHSTRLLPFGVRSQRSPRVR